MAASARGRLTVNGDRVREERRRRLAKARRSAARARMRARRASAPQLVLSWPSGLTEEMLLRNVVARIIRRGGRARVQ